MSRYIEREEVLRIIGDNCPRNKYGYKTEEDMLVGETCKRMMIDIKNIPTADVAARLADALSLIKELTEEIKDLTETVEVRGKVVEKLQIAINEIEEDNRKITEENERLRANNLVFAQKIKRKWEILIWKYKI